MKKTVSLLMALLMIMSISAISASASVKNAEYTYIVDDVECRVEFANSTASAEKQEFIAQKLVGLYDDNAHAYGLRCTLFGHKLKYTTASVVRHKVSSSQPRCYKENYEVEYCENCDYTVETFLTGTYINCCPND